MNEKKFVYIGTYEEEPFDYEGEADYLRKKEKEDKIVKQMETKLKTLKDIEIERAKICNGCNKDCNGYKFKTCGWNYNKLGELIRQEAIKWIKELKKDNIEWINTRKTTNKVNFGNKLILFNKKGKPFQQIDCHAKLTIRWIKHFFNIKEEELK